MCQKHNFVLCAAFFSVFWLRFSFNSTWQKIYKNWCFYYFSSVLSLFLSHSLSPPPALPNFTAFSFAFFHTQPPFIQTHAHAHKKNKSETELLHRIYLIIMKKDGNKMKREKNTHTKNYGALLMFLFLNLFFVLFFLLLLFRLHVG